MSVVIKGLPADHSLAGIMGEYVEQAELFDGFSPCSSDDDDVEGDVVMGGTGSAVDSAHPPAVQPPSTLPVVRAMASNWKTAGVRSPLVVSTGRALGPARPHPPTESLSQVSTPEASPMSVVIKGLPADHSLFKCMGEYVEQAERFDGRSSFVGGRFNDMTLSFSNSLGWAISAKDEQSIFLFSEGTKALLPHLVMSAWTVCEQQRGPSSVQIEKFKRRETMLKLGGVQDLWSFEGVYRKQDHTHNGKPMYASSDNCNFIWFQENFGWCVGIEGEIGTRSCYMHADDFAATPDAVQSTWMVRRAPVDDPRVQVVLASAECTPSLLDQQHGPAPVSMSIPEPTLRQELRSAPENTPPPTIAVVGVGEGLSGVYEKQQPTYNGKVMYKGSRADGNRVIYYACGRWSIGPCGSNGTVGSFVCTNDSAVSPHTLAEDTVWQEYVREPCNSVRVTKSKKKHTKVIEIKGVPAATHDLLTRLNGRYRPQALKIDGRPTFKGGDGGNQAIWYSESAGSWRIGYGDLVGTAVYCVHAKDTARVPNAVKSTWEVVSIDLNPYPYAKIILPTLEAAKQEVPRQMQLKMAEVLVAEQKRCLCCGGQYLIKEEVAFHEECMHHHCMCCREEQDIDSCAVCAEAGKCS
jgi:hypothetical protein